MRGSSLLLSTIAVLALIAGALLLLRSTDESDSAGPVPATTPITEPPVTRSPVTPPPVIPPPVTPPPPSIESTLSVESYDTDALDRFLGTLDKASPATTAPAPGGPVSVGTAQDDSPFDLAVTKYVGAAVYDVATTPGWVWAVAENGLHRVDPATGSIDATIALPRVSPKLPPGYKANLEAHAGTLWVSHGDVLSRVSSESATVTGTIELDGWDRFGTRPLAVDESGVWVATSNRVLRINPEDLQVTGELTFRASGLVVGADSVWVLADQRVTRIDPATLKTMASITLSRSVGYPSIGTPLTFGQGAVWFSAGGLSRIDATTNEAETVHSDPDCCAVIVGFVGDHILTYGLLDHGIALIDPDARGGLKRVATTPSAVFAIEGDEDGFWAVASRSGMLYRHDLRTEAVVEPSTLSGSWTEFSAADGLPEGFGTAVTIGGDGAVWATVADPQSDWGNCTPARFDGTSWTSFAPANTGCVEFMLPAPSGGVIAAVTFPTGTDAHVTLSETHLMEFDGTAWINHTVLHDLPVVEPFNGRALDDGTVVFAANWLSAWETPDRLGLVLMTYDGDSWQVARAQAIPAGVHAGSAWKGIAIDAAGDAWFIDSGAAVQLSHDGTTRHEFGEDQGGILWISATPWSDVWTIAGPTLYRYDGTTWTAHVEGQGLTPHGIQQRGDIDPGYALGYPTQDGSFWISESTGVSVFRDGAWIALDREEAPGIPQSFGAMHAGAVVQAADGSTWVVTPSGSVHRYADGPWLRVMSGGIAFEVHTPGDVAIAPDGSAWFSTLDGIGRFVPNE